MQWVSAPPLLVLHYLQKRLSRAHYCKGNVPCVFSLVGLGGRLLWVEGVSTTTAESEPGEST